jgi:legumain
MALLLFRIFFLVHNHGIPDDHIIVMMYDDIAMNPENPTPGR